MATLLFTSRVRSERWRSPPIYWTVVALLMLNCTRAAVATVQKSWSFCQITSDFTFSSHRSTWFHLASRLIYSSSHGGYPWGWDSGTVTSLSSGGSGEYNLTPTRSFCQSVDTMCFRTLLSVESASRRSIGKQSSWRVAFKMVSPRFGFSELRQRKPVFFSRKRSISLCVPRSIRSFFSLSFPHPPPPPPISRTEPSVFATFLFPPPPPRAHFFSTPPPNFLPPRTAPP